MQRLGRNSNSNKTIGHIQLGALLGQGGFGQVMLGYDTQKKHDVAVKFIDKKLIKENDLLPYVEREIEVMKKLKHPHVVTLLSVINSNKGYYLVMELASNGELFDRIVESKRFSEGTARKYFQELISALSYCHKKGIVHRDLKAENLLVGKNNNLLVCDFGLSRYVSAAHLDDKKVVFTSLAGSVDYQAPEVIKEEGYQGYSCDIWSCGVILFFMMCGYLPFATTSTEETYTRILNCQYNKENKYLTEGVKSLLKGILVVNPQQRMTMDDIINHPWFRADLPTGMFPDTPTASSPTNPVSPLCSGGISPNNPASPTSCSSPNAHSGSNGFGNSPHGNEQPVEDIRVKISAAFCNLNVDHSGLLTRSQVKDMMVKIYDKPITEVEVDTFVANFDHDPEGRITEEQFILGWTQNQQVIDQHIDLQKLINLFHYDLETELLVTLRRAFEKFDLEKNGIITEDDVKALAKSLDITDDECSELRVLMGGTETISFERFVKFCTTSNVLKMNPIARRMRRVGEMFDVADGVGYKNYINNGFTVAGLRETIMQKLVSLGPQDMNCKFTRGDQEGFLLASQDGGDNNNHISVGVQLLPSCPGYTKVLAYRIQGKTNLFHDWFRQFRKLLRCEILECEQDSAPVGEPMLM